MADTKISGLPVLTTPAGTEEIPLNVSGVNDKITIANLLKYNKVKQTEIDFGSLPVPDGTFTITDSTVSSTSLIVASMSYDAPTGKDQDELECDDLQLRCSAGSGQFTMYAKSADGSYLHDKFKVNYWVTT